MNLHFPHIQPLLSSTRCSTGKIDFHPLTNCMLYYPTSSSTWHHRMPYWHRTYPETFHVETASLLWLINTIIYHSSWNNRWHFSAWFNYFFHLLFLRWLPPHWRSGLSYQNTWFGSIVICCKKMDLLFVKYFHCSCLFNAITSYKKLGQFRGRDNTAPYHGEDFMLSTFCLMQFVALIIRFAPVPN
jgi:hypothetical protein